MCNFFILLLMKAVWLVPRAALATSLSRRGDRVCWNTRVLSTWRLLRDFTISSSPEGVDAVFVENRNEERMSEVFERSDWSI